MQTFRSLLLFAYYALRPGPDVICLLTYLQIHTTLVLYPRVILKIHTVDDGIVSVFSCFMFFHVSIAHVSQCEEFGGLIVSHIIYMSV